MTEVVPDAGGHGEVRLRNGGRLEVSRRRFKDLAGRLWRVAHQAAEERQFATSQAGVVAGR